MANASITDVVSSHIEAVRKELPSLYETSQQLAAKIKSTNKVEKVNRKLYRIPFELFPGGQFGKYSADGGTLGSGNSFRLSNLTAGYFYSRQAHQLTQEQIETTEDSTKATVNAFQREMARAIITAQVMDDITLHNDGTGVLTNASSASTSTSNLTFAGATDQLRTNRLREGMAVEVWDSGLTTKRSGYTGILHITVINWTTNEITLNKAVTDMVSTDRLAISGVDAYGPATPTSFSSTWPATGTAAGLGGDSFRHGIYYSNDNTAANYFLGVQKSAVPQLLPAYISGASGALTFTHGLQILDQLRQRRDQDNLEGLIGVFHMKQREQVFNAGIAIAEHQIGTDFGGSVDVMPSNQKYQDGFKFAGIPCFVSKRQFRDRVDFINPQKWGRAVVQEIDFFTNQEGKRIFEGRGSDGTVSAFIEFFLTAGFDFVNFDPGCQGYIDTLDVPA